MIMCEVTTYSKEYNAFSRKLLEKFYASRKDQNLIFSPFSILMMLAIAADATAGNTRNEIAGVLSSKMNYEETLFVLKEIQKAFALVSEKFGEVDILVNNAGYGVSGATELVSESECRKIFDVNFFGSLFCMQEALPMMKSGSKIVNISSACAIFALPFRTLYCASKAATSMLSHSIRLELKNSGIEVFAICPGDIKTNFTKNRVKNFQTNIRYGDRIEKATNKIDSREDKRMTLDFASSKIFKIIMKKKHKAQYIIGGKYKALYFAQKIFPINLVLNATNKLMG